MALMEGKLKQYRHASPWMRALPAADYLGIALGTLRNWTSTGYVPYAKRGRIVRYHRDELDRWLSEAACPGHGASMKAAASPGTDQEV